MAATKEDSAGSVQNLVGSWVVALVSLGTLASLGYGYVHGVERRFADLESALAETKTKSLEHLDNAREWKERIISCEHATQKIQTDALSRYDPFTGAQGREHNKRLSALEVVVPQVRFNTERIKRLEKNVHGHPYGRTGAPGMGGMGGMAQEDEIQ
jgi:hypothetical protein